MIGPFHVYEIKIALRRLSKKSGVHGRATRADPMIALTHNA